MFTRCGHQGDHLLSGHLPKSGPATSTVAAVGAAKWVAVAALWGGMIIGSWSPATAESAEDKEIALFCERYEEVQGLNRTQMLEELIEYAPVDDPTATIDEIIGMCRNG